MSTGLYAADGSWNVSVVTHADRLMAADGSINVVISPGASNKYGAYNPSGGLYVTNTSVPVNTRRTPDGALYVTTNNSSGAQRVTVVSGSFSPGSNTNTSNQWFFLLGN